MLKQPTFQIDGDIIRITNCHPRGQSITLAVIAALLAIAPLIRPYLPEDSYFAFEDGNGGLALWLLGIFACVSAAFWWSVVDIDPKAGEVAIRRRWGLFRSQFRGALSSCSAVAVREDDDGRCSIYLECTAPKRGLEFNNGKALVWGRDSAETERIARRIAEHLKLPLHIHLQSAWSQFHA
jgi:hypothetical protein